MIMDVTDVVTVPLMGATMTDMASVITIDRMTVTKTDATGDVVVTGTDTIAMTTGVRKHKRGYFRSPIALYFTCQPHARIL